MAVDQRPVDEQGPCAESIGNEVVTDDGLTEHVVMLDQQGYCPWCGHIETEVDHDLAARENYLTWGEW